MPNFLRPDIGKKRTYELKVSKPKLPDINIADQPFQYAYIHVSTWCLRDLLNSLPARDIQVMFELVKIMRKNENVLLNRLEQPAITKNEILSAIGHPSDSYERVLTRLIKNEVVGRFNNPTEKGYAYFVNPYVFFYGTKIPDYVYELFTDSKWRIYHKSYGIEDVEL